jgi:hypothetical protein
MNYLHILKIEKYINKVYHFLDVVINGDQSF